MVLCCARPSAQLSAPYQQVVLPEGFGALPALRKVQLATLYLGREGASPSGYTPPPQPAPKPLAQLSLLDCTGDFPFGSGMDGLRTL
jgi:hypothetical protein